MAKKINSLSGIVFSTDPSFKMEEDEQQMETPLPADQQLKIRLETKHRAGKVVTLVDGFRGALTDKEELGKKLKIAI